MRCRERIEAHHDCGKPWDSRGRFDLQGHCLRNWQPAMNQTVDICAVMPSGAGYALDGVSCIPDQLAYVDTHALNSVSSLQKVKGVRDADSGLPPQNEPMPRWKYRDAFNADYLAFHKGSDLSHEELAEKLGKSHHAIATYRRKGESGSIPPEDVIRKFAALVGKSPFTYMDDPRVGDGVGLETYADMPQWKKDILQRNLRGIDGSTLPPQVWEMLLDQLLTQARSMEAAILASKKDVTK